jgi:hypothetical protein
MAGRGPLTLDVYDCAVKAGEARGLGCGISLRMWGGTFMPPM